MNKVIIVVLLLILQPALSKSNKTEQADHSGNVFIFTIHFGECIPCLNNAYLLADYIIQSHIPKERILFILQEKRKGIKVDYEERLSHIFDSKKLCFIWNDKLYNDLQIGEDKTGLVSQILVFDTKTNTFIFKAASKSLSSSKLCPYLTCH